MAENFSINSARINRLFNKLDDTVEKFLEKNGKTTNEEIHMAFYRLYLTRELQPLLMLMNQFNSELDRDGRESSYIK